MLSPIVRFQLTVQKLLGYINFSWFIPLVVLILKRVQCYRIANVYEFRQRVRQLTQEAHEQSRPIVIAANHLTALDSVIINWALYPWTSYLKSFRLFPWNVPEYENFGKRPLLRLGCYLGKCVYIRRQGSREQKKLALDKLKYLCSHGEAICIFPEGGRSRTGKVDRSQAAYGVGQILNELEDPIVWCIYLRGYGQDTYTWFPAKKEHFHIDIRTIEPQSERSGMRAARDKTQQIFQTLEDMEADYFDHR